MKQDNLYGKIFAKMILVWFQHHPRTRLRHRIPCGLQRRGNPSWEQSTMPHGSHNDTEWQWHPPKRRLDSSFSRKHHLLPCYELMYLFLRKIWRVLWKLDRHQPPVHSMSTYIPKCHLKRTSILFTTHFKSETRSTEISPCSLILF